MTKTLVYYYAYSIIWKFGLAIIFLEKTWCQGQLFKQRKNTKWYNNGQMMESKRRKEKKDLE